MPFTQTVMPQYRDADEDGLIGIRGATRYFQDIHTWYFHSINKGNDVLPEAYGAGWVYTRYHVELLQKMDYSATAELTAWMEPYRQPVLISMNMTVRQGGKMMAYGKIESCVFSLARQRPLRLNTIDFPEDFAEEIPNDIPGFIGLEKTADGMEEQYQRTVRVSDLDKMGHMTNLRYIEMFQDAHDSKFWKALNPTGMEIAFLSQCREGETLSVKSRPEENAVHLAAVHADGKLASVAAFFGGNR